MKHIAIYQRVSTADGRQTVQNQTPDLKRWVEAHAGDSPVAWYSDEYTGKSMDRPGWQKLQNQIESGNVTTLVCHRLDRLGRTASGLCKLFDDLQSRKINLVSLKDGVDLSTAAGRLLAGVMASVAQYDNEVRTSRIREGQERAKREGKSWGGSKAGRLLTTTAEQVSTVLRLKGEGVSISAIARSVGLSRPTIYRLIEQNS